MTPDPIRLAFGSFSPADGGPPIGPDEAPPVPGTMTFDELLQGLNPLHHVPVIGTIYRAVTGETVQPIFRVLAGGLFGGPPGMIMAAIMAMMEETQPGAAIAGVLRNEGAPPDRAEEARLAYQMQGNGAG